MHAPELVIALTHLTTPENGMEGVGIMKVTSTYNPPYQQLDLELGISCLLQQMSIKSWVPWFSWLRHEPVRTWLRLWAGYLFYVLPLMCSDLCSNQYSESCRRQLLGTKSLFLTQNAAESTFAFRFTLFQHKCGILRDMRGIHALNY